MESPFFTLPDLAAYLLMSEGTLRNWLSEGEFPWPVVRIGKNGKNVRVLKSVIEAWVASQNPSSDVPRQVEPVALRRRGRPRKSDGVVH